MKHFRDVQSWDQTSLHPEAHGVPCEQGSLKGRTGHTVRTSLPGVRLLGMYSTERTAAGGHFISHI
jgi:hypothetical protein